VARLEYWSLWIVGVKGGGEYSECALDGVVRAVNEMGGVVGGLQYESSCECALELS